MAPQDYSFDWTIAPVRPATFFSENSKRRPLRVARNDPAYFFGDLLSFDDIDRVVTTMGLSVPEITVTRSAGDITAADYAYETGVIDPVRVKPAVRRWCHCDPVRAARNACRSLPGSAVHRWRRMFLQPVQYQPSTCQTESQGGSKPITTITNVIVLQIAGTKEWRLYDTPGGTAADLVRPSTPGAGSGRRGNRPLPASAGATCVYVPRGLAP